MKKCLIVLLAAFLTSTAAPVFAQSAQEQEQCAISANTCGARAQMLEKRIKRMKERMKKGEGHYKAEDMKMLEQKLQDALDQVDKMEKEAK